MVEFTPAHSHPFSVTEAAALDVGTIVGEINRLRNSLAHLATSQAELQQYLSEEEDADLRAAWTENEGVIASQSERVTLLRAVLVSKVGEDSLAHYGIETGVEGGANGTIAGDGHTGSTQPPSAPTGPSAVDTVRDAAPPSADDAGHADDAGLHL